MVKIAYLILAHNNPSQIKRLVDSLSCTGDFYIYIDKKKKLKLFTDKLKGYGNVSFYKQRKKVNWAAWSVVRAYLELLSASLSSAKNYDRFVLLTGQDYPLMKNSEILSFFETNKEVEFIMAYNLTKSTAPGDVKKLHNKYYLDNPFRSRFLQKVYKGITCRVITKIFKRKSKQVLLDGQSRDVYFGQMLSSFTRSGAEKVVGVFQNDKNYNRQMKRFFAPDELYWQTIIFNSELRSKTVQGGQEHEKTEHFGWAPLHYHHYYVYTSVFTIDDYNEIKDSGYMFFRKVVPGISDSLMDKIDELRKE